MKGFMSFEFDTADEVLTYIRSTPEKDGSYKVIRRDGLPESFLQTFDDADLTKEALLYVIFGKEEPGCVSMLRIIR